MLTPAPIVQPEPSQPLPSTKLEQFCLAIREKEGYFVGSRSFRNCNPGNVKFSPVGYDPIYGVVKKDSANFAIFKDYETGFLYLKNLVTVKARQYPQQTINQFIAIYAPEYDNNDSVAYADFLGNKLGVDNNVYTMGELLV